MHWNDQPEQVCAKNCIFLKLLKPSSILFLLELHHKRSGSGLELVWQFLGVNQRSADCRRGEKIKQNYPNLTDISSPATEICSWFNTITETILKCIEIYGNQQLSYRPGRGPLTPAASSSALLCVVGGFISWWWTTEQWLVDKRLLVQFPGPPGKTSRMLVCIWTLRRALWFCFFCLNVQQMKVFHTFYSQILQ